MVATHLFVAWASWRVYGSQEYIITEDPNVGPSLTCNGLVLLIVVLVFVHLVNLEMFCRACTVGKRLGRIKTSVRGLLERLQRFRRPCTV